MSLFPKVGRKQFGLRVAWWGVVGLLMVGVILHLFPFYYMMAMSFTPARETMSATPVFFPKEPTAVAWKLVYAIASKDTQGLFKDKASVMMLLDRPFLLYFRNSLIQVFGTLIFSLPITAFAAYANSKLQRGPIARWSFLFFIGTMMVPYAVTLIPAFLLTRNFPFPMAVVPNIPGTETPFPVLRTWNTHWAIIIPAIFNGFNFLLFKGYFDTIPDSIIQAARVDGGSEFNIFRRIIIPMSVPVIAVAAWTQFGGQWDAYMWPLMTIQNVDLQPVTVAIASLIDAFTKTGATNAQAAANMNLNPNVKKVLEAGLSWNGLMVLGLLQSFPIFVMFVICREYLMKGIRIRGLR